MNGNRVTTYATLCLVFMALSLGVGAVAYLFLNGTATFALLIGITGSKVASMALFGACTLVGTAMMCPFEERSFKALKVRLKA